jgi:flagellin-like hook-associated protein FlgL
VTRTQSRVGADQVSVDESAQRVSALHLDGESRLSKQEDVNLAEAISRMTRARTAYEAALGAVGTAGRTSLLDYLS